MGVWNCPCGISEATYLYIFGIFLDSIRDKVLNFHSNISCIVSLTVIRVVIHLYIYIYITTLITLRLTNRLTDTTAHKEDTCKREPLACVFLF